MKTKITACGETAHGRPISRVRIAVAAFCMQLVFGAVYGWSVFLNPLREQFGASKSEASLTFTITLAVLGATAAFGGSLQRRIGPRATATLAGLLYGCGVILSGFAPSLGALYLSYGVLGGIGLGFGYIVPLAVLIAWFPDKRGFITGLAVAGFGLGAFVTSPLATELIALSGVQHTLVLLGTGSLVIAVAAAQFLRPAPADYAPPGWTPTAQQRSIPATELTLSEALRTPHWYLLWSMLALNVTAGAALISVAAPLAQELTQVGPALGAIAVCLISLFNGAGRLFWGTMSDRIGRSRAFMAMFLLQAIAFALLPATDQFWLLLVPVALIALCYGGGFGTMPAFATDVFGAKNAGTIYGAMLTAWSAGAILGPLLIAAVPYRTALPIIVCLLAVANILPVVFNAFAQRGAVRTTVSFRRKRAAARWRMARGRAAHLPGVAGWPGSRRAASTHRRLMACGVTAGLQSGPSRTAEREPCRKSMSTPSRAARRSRRRR